jgi:hypothetical protein
MRRPWCTGIKVDGINYMVPIDADDRRAVSSERERGDAGRSGL